MMGRRPMTIAYPRPAMDGSMAGPPAELRHMERLRSNRRYARMDRQRGLHAHHGPAYARPSHPPTARRHRRLRLMRGQPVCPCAMSVSVADDGVHTLSTVPGYALARAV